MYFPYLRGRQFELIALRELLEESIISERVIPVIEPVKVSSTLTKTITTFEKRNRKVGLVINPQVGDFCTNLDKEKNSALKQKCLDIDKSPAVIKTHILNKQSTNQLIDMFNAGAKPEEIITVCSNKDFIPFYESTFSGSKAYYNLISDETIFRRKIKDNRVLLADKFKKKERNSDYAAVIDEPFSDDHLYFKDDGYVGFSDYSVIGNEYTESGFAPYAVAIHIVYFDKDKSLRIRHFVSDTNDDITDPAGKFSEALKKLVDWNKDEKLDTVGIKAFEGMYEKEVYPGLGTVKKLVIMHHIELISRYLDGKI